MDEILERLDCVICLLEQMPEVLTATFLLMQEEKEHAAFRGKKAADLWTISRPDQHENR